MSPNPSFPPDHPPTPEEIFAFVNAARDGRLDEVTRALDAYGETIIEGKDMNDDTALTWAAFKGHLDIIELLLERGADINNKGMNGDTALSWAAQGGRLEAAELLLARGAVHDIPGGKGMTALAFARLRGYQEIVRVLEEWPQVLEERRLEEERIKQEAAQAQAARERLEKLKEIRPAKPMLRKNNKKNQGPKP